MKQQEIEKAGSAVVAGDLFKLGPRVHRVVRFEPYPGFSNLVPGYTARIAHFDTGSSMTIPDQQNVRVVSA